ncbi:hypothetical protein [Palleronia sp.]|uniref:hypothetical protein n=1 Tax=Palleronia sp. TaxID=1940284 RepID=UPI0035C7C23F
MKRTIAATTIALAALTAPVFAQTAQQDVQSPAPQQVSRDVNGFRIADDAQDAHSPRVQQIFDELRAEKGTGTTN